MLNHSRTLKQGFVVCAVLLIASLILQLSVGPVAWHAFRFPANLFLLFALFAFIGLLYVLSLRFSAFQFLRSFAAAAPALLVAVVLTIVMGLIKQEPFGKPSLGLFGFTNMVSSWPFVIIYFYIVLILGLASLHRMVHFRLSNIPFLMNHLGLFLVIIAAALGRADMQRLTMNVVRNTSQNFAVDEHGMVTPLPMSIRLISFDIEEYPPKLILIGNHTSMETPTDKPPTLVVDKNFRCGKLGGWSIKLKQHIHNAAPIMKPGKSSYIPWNSSGAVCALCVEAEKGALHKTGWITCGSYLFPYNMMVLDDNTSLVMPKREPQRFVSNVLIRTRNGKTLQTTIEVNKPITVDDWMIYQLSYDTSRGKWSEISVLELVRDPWLPAVYAGIILLAIGTVCMLLDTGRRKEERG